MLAALIVSDPAFNGLWNARAACSIPNNYSTPTIRITTFTYDAEGRLAHKGSLISVSSPEWPLSDPFPPFRTRAEILLRYAGLRVDATLRFASGVHFCWRLSSSNRIKHLGGQRRFAAATAGHDGFVSRRYLVSDARVAGGCVAAISGRARWTESLRCSRGRWIWMG